MKPYSQYEEFPLPEQKMYATYRDRHGPNLKFQRIGPAKSALRNAIYLGRLDDGMKIYRQEGDKFVIIFDGKSELAQAYADSHITYEELVKQIFG